MVAVVAGVVWYRVGAGADDPAAPSTSATATSAPEPDAAAEPGAAGAGGSGEPTGGRELLVHVAGAVLRPGVLELGAGARVIDAVEGAGGALADADLDRLNLAAKVADGQRVLVPRVGEPALAGDPTTAGPGAGADPASGALVDLNTATPAQLEELPGIGPVLAGAIVDERERRGGFRSVNELRDVRGIGEKRFADLRALVTV